MFFLFFLVKRVPGRGPEQRESEKTVLYLRIITILVSYIIIYYHLIINYREPYQPKLETGLQLLMFSPKKLY